jgi:transcription-repair coupling factor (superfamily II helicase)
LAKGLIQLYAQRQKTKGYAFSPDSPWQTEFEEAFEYTETDDQLRCIREIKEDMERPVPMDRLLCGDVGYGKTEVALRAVMKCVLDGKQAAILVPTTVLAQQHYATAVNRFRSFPVKIAVLSRFQTTKESRKILQDLKNGSIDLLIGTHRLLQKGVAFHDLGLLVIDEEQRFGVSHKEKLKELSKQVDVLTLSATPIPRTLNMALSRVRDMSTIETPPENRQSVQTYVLEHDWSVLADAMRREIQRGGQVYYLHNRIDTIERVAAHVQELLGEEAHVVVAHGKLSEQQLSSVMQEVIDGAAQVLVCTTIIETGIDIPNVNTLIIEDADHMGLAQLHQLRGRIGRSARRAYAYMTYRRGKILSETADKRLSAIREYVEFGSGFKIAMRDLEIRGAGNLLGAEQSGFMMSVGYDMYLKLLEEAVLEEQGQEQLKERECSADLNLSANIPEKYVPSPEQRMDLYRRIATIRTRQDADELLDEMLDRYGEVPRSVLTLLDVALLRAAAAKVGVTEISQKGDTVTFILGDMDLQRLAMVCGMKKYHSRLRLGAGSTPCMMLRLEPKGDVLEQCMELIDALSGAAEASDGEK